MVIDIHTYLDRRPGASLTPTAADAYAQACGVDLILVSNTPDARQHEVDANLACLQACQGCQRLAPLYWARPGSFDSNLHAFIGALDSEPFAGAVFSLSTGDAAAGGEGSALDAYVIALKKLGLAALFDVSAGQAAIEQVGALARRHPSLNAVVRGAGRAHGWLQAVAEVRRGVQRGDANLYLDSAGARIEEVVEAVAALGAERILFGSGGTIGDQNDAQGCRGFLADLNKRLAAADFRKVTGDNPARLLGRAAGGPG
jgi:hypothetical protein